MKIESPKPGDIGLTKITGLTGWCIRVAQRLNGADKRLAKFEHALIYVGDDWCIEAQPGGAVRSKVSERYAKREITWVSAQNQIALMMSYGWSSEGLRSKLVTTAEHFVGTPYSFLDYLAILLHHFKINFRFVKDRVASSDHMICSQLVDEVYTRNGMHLFSDGRWPGYVTPADLAQVLGA